MDFEIRFADNACHAGSARQTGKGIARPIPLQPQATPTARQSPTFQTGLEELPELAARYRPAASNNRQLKIPRLV